MPRALILKFGAIGDVIMVLPAAWQLHLAGYRIDWVCGPAVLPILRLYPWINAITADDRGILTGSVATRIRAILALWGILRRTAGGETYAVVGTLYYDPRYRILALPVSGERKLQLSWSDRARRILPGRRHTDEFARILLGKPDDVKPMQLAPVPPPSLPDSPVPSLGRVRIVLAPAGARNMMAEAILRRWPAENYVALTRMLLEQVPGVEVVLIGGPDDAWVQPHFAGLPVMDVIGKYSLVQTIALLDTAAVFVSHDTGPLHLAGLARTGIVALFGPTDPHVFLPQRPGVMALWGGEGFACRPCYDGHSFAPCASNDCMAQITPAMVLDEVLAMLDDRARGVLAAPRIVTPSSTMAALTQIELGS